MNYDIILSFTSWKGRIYDTSFLFVLLSMLKQKTSFKYKVVLVLSTDEFRNKEKDLPPRLVELNELCDWSYSFPHSNYCNFLVCMIVYTYNFVYNHNWSISTCQARIPTI